MNREKSSINLSNQEFIPNPINVITQTLKNPFELEEINNKYKIQEEEQREKIANELNAQNIPKFFLSEKRLFITKLLFFFFLFMATVSTTGWLVYVYFQWESGQAGFNWFNIGYFILVAIVGLFTFVMWITYWIKTHFLNKEIRLIANGFDRNNVSSTIQRIYKSIIISFSNINWLAFYVYIIGGFSMLIIFTVSFSMQLNAFVNDPTLAKPVFGQLTILKPEDQLHTMPKVSVICISSIVGFALVVQIFTIIFNMIRIRRIESAYSVPIISGEVKLAIKKSINKRNLIIFIILSIVLTIGFFIIYFIFKKLIK